LENLTSIEFNTTYLLGMGFNRCLKLF